MHCPNCSANNPEENRFCGNCGQPLDVPVISTPPLKTSSFKGERKHATVLFSDLSGYTAMTEKMDPEEVKTLMGDIFEQAGKIVEKYEGTVERFFGDEIMVLFGVPKAHEDDPVRAIHAAIEIHKLVKNLSPEFEKRAMGSLSMHTGINSGLVITGDEYIGKGRHGLTGDTINLAKRLTGLAKPGEIIIGPDTHKIAENHFSFERRDPVSVKGKKEPVQTFQVIDTDSRPQRTKQLHRVRADLIGREKELLLFGEAVKALEAGSGSVLCLYGDAGTGKSRLVEEFKASTHITWYEGCSYPYTQNIPYFPLLTLFNNAFGMKEEDVPDVLKTKIEKNILSLIKDGHDIIPYIGTLYALSYPEVDSVSPEFWKSKLFSAVFRILSALAQKQPTIVCIEDLHWADPSFLELIRFIQSDFNFPILFLYVARPLITLFFAPQIDQIKLPYQEIRIDDLSSKNSQVMVESLLNSKNIPFGLKIFVETKTQGNPFYLEEMINSLIESKVLFNNNGVWHLEREITESDISSSIYGVISARIDRLEAEYKQILQEASVIGRSFYYEIINRITKIKNDIHHCLETLEGFDLIKSKESKIDLEYIFKHALTQEVVYNGLLKSERQLIHEKIGQVIEQIFEDRLPEFYETLAHHFSKGTSTLKAVDYLMKSGDKSLKRYSVDESHQYFRQAFDLIHTLPDKTLEINEVIVDLLNRWALVFYYRGDYKNLGILLSSQAHLIDHINDKEKIGMFYAWQGNAVWIRGDFLKAKDFLKKAEKIGIEINSQKIIGYACTWLSWIYADLGFFKKGIEYAERANKTGKIFKEDHYIYFKSLGGLAYNHFYSGNASGCIKAGEELIQYGNKTSQARSLGMGYNFKACGYSNTGDISTAISFSEQSVSISGDPFYTLGFRTILSLSYIQNDDMEKAKDTIEKALKFSNKNGCELFGDIAKLLQGVLLIDKGQMAEGLKLIKDIERLFVSQQRKGGLLLARLILGKVYLEIMQKNKPVRISTVLKNMGFIIKNVPWADKKAISYYGQTIDLAEETGAIGIMAQAHLDLGILHKIKKRNDMAKKHLEKAIKVFQEIDAHIFLKQAKEELNALG